MFTSVGNLGYFAHYDVRFQVVVVDASGVQRTSDWSGVVPVAGSGRFAPPADEVTATASTDAPGAYDVTWQGRAGWSLSVGEAWEAGPDPDLSAFFDQGGGTQTVGVAPGGFLEGVFTDAQGDPSYAFALTGLIPVTPSPPAAPTNLSATAGTDGQGNLQVNLVWDDNADDETGYTVERSVDGVNFTQVGTTPAGQTTFVDTSSVVYGTVYFYRVAASVAAITSAYSNVAQAALVYRAIGLAIDNVESNEVDLSWNDDPEARSYIVYRAPQDDPTNFAKLSTIEPDGSGVEIYDDTTAAPASDFVYKVVTSSATSPALYGPVDVSTAPLPPTDLTVSDLNSSSVTLNWQENSGDPNPPDGYVIWREDVGNLDSFTQMGTADAGVTSFQDSGVAGGSHYYYEVDAVRPGQDSGHGQILWANVPPAAPPDVPSAANAAAGATEGIDLAWSTSGGGVARYVIQQSEDGYDFTTIDYVGPDLATYHDSFVRPGHSYVLRVSAENAAGGSGFQTTGVVIAPAGSTGAASALPTQGPPDLPGDTVGDLYLDGEIKWAATAFDTHTASLNVQEAQALIDSSNLSSQIQLAPAGDGEHATFHVYAKGGIFSGGEFLHSFTFDANDETSVQEAFTLAQRAAVTGYIHTTAQDVHEITDTTVETAGFFIPGPQDVLFAAAVDKLVPIMAKLGYKMAWKGTEWVFEKAGRTLAGEAKTAAVKLAREELIGVIGDDAVKWSAYDGKHVARGSLDWATVVARTVGDAAKYRTGTDVELLERYVWQNGTAATNGKNFKVMAFDYVIGANEGQEVKWMRVEMTSGTIHGHPISLQEYRKLTR